MLIMDAKVQEILLELKHQNSDSSRTDVFNLNHGRSIKRIDFYMKIVSKWLQLCSQSGVCDDAFQLLFVYLIWCCSVYWLHKFDFYGIF